MRRLQTSLEPHKVSYALDESARRAGDVLAVIIEGARRRGVLVAMHKLVGQDSNQLVQRVVFRRWAGCTMLDVRERHVDFLVRIVELCACCVGYAAVIAEEDCYGSCWRDAGSEGRPMGVLRLWR